MTKWKLVPVDPTPEICAVICNAGCIYLSEDELYVALLEAAPQPPKLSDERILEICGFRPESAAEIGADIVRKRWLEIARAIEREILGGTEK